MKNTTMSVSIVNTYITKRGNNAVELEIIYGELKLSYWTAYLNNNKQVTEIQAPKCSYVAASWKLCDEIKPLVTAALSSINLKDLPVKVWHKKGENSKNGNTNDNEAANTMLDADNRAAI